MALLRGRCRLPELLDAINMSQAEFARRMGVSESNVSRWITGERLMRYENTVKAARVLGCHAEDLYEFFEVKKGKRQ